MNYEVASGWRYGCEDHPTESDTFYSDPQPDAFWQAKVKYLEQMCVHAIETAARLDARIAEGE